jgi:hypothetical protein
VGQVQAQSKRASPSRANITVAAIVVPAREPALRRHRGSARPSSIAGRPAGAGEAGSNWKVGAEEESKMPLIAIMLSHYWKPLALVVLVAAALGYRTVLVHERGDALKKVARLTAEAVALRASNQALGATIDRQNAAVADIKTRADAAVNAMAADQAAAAREGEAAETKSEQEGRALIAAPIDSKSGCEGAIQWGNAQAAGLSSW